MTSSFRALLVVALTRSSWAFESLSDFSVRTASGDEVSLAQYQAPVTLIVNTASKCGFTGQYKGLEELAQKYGASLQVLAFPCNQFFGQEPGSDAEVQAFVKSTYGVTFPVFAKVEVNGENAHPLFSWLKEKTSADSVKQAPWAKAKPGHERDAQWNFSKWLLFRGVPVKRFDFDVEPKDLAGEIDALLQRDKAEL